MITLSAHAITRITGRLSKLTNTMEVETIVNRFRIKENRAYIQIKKMPYVEIADPEVKPDGIARGDTLVAIYDHGEIVSVILRKSWSNSGEYSKIYKNPNK